MRIRNKYVNKCTFVYIITEKGDDFLSRAEKRNYVLTSEECNYIEKLIIKNQSIVRAVIRTTLGERFELLCDDCISELYLLMCERINKLKNHENPDGWIVVAAKNIAINAMRKHNTQLKHTITEEIIDIPVEDNVFESALYNIWLKDGVIEKLLDKLTPHEREIYNYLYQKRLPPKKVAEIMGLSHSTIRNINAKIKKKIQNGLNENNP